jgi:alpha-ketoglutarate-dependent taurine dioxygenase
MIWETSLTPATASSSLRSLVDAWRAEDNKVFVIRGSEIADPRAFYTDHFGDIGLPVPLAEDVAAGDRDHQRTGQIWMEVRYDPKHPDAYRHSANAQPLHTDGSYIPDFPNATLMTCVASAGEGGETTFIDSDDVVAALREENPELLERLTSAPLPHERSGDRRVERVIEEVDGATLVNWNYYCVAKNVDETERKLADDFFNFLQTSPAIKAATKGVKLTPGDAVTWKDRQVLHGRNGFSASMESERFLWKCAIDVGNLGN